MNILAYADDIELIGKNEIEIRKKILEMEYTASKFGLWINQEKTKYMIVERKNSLKKNKIEHLKIKNLKFKMLEYFKYLGVILNEDKNNQIDLKERINNAQKNILCYRIFLKIKTYKRK